MLKSHPTGSNVDIISFKSTVSDYKWRMYGHSAIGYTPDKTQGYTERIKYLRHSVKIFYDSRGTQILTIKQKSAYAYYTVHGRYHRPVPFAAQTSPRCHSISSQRDISLSQGLSHLLCRAVYSIPICAVQW